MFMIVCRFKEYCKNISIHNLTKPNQVKNLKSHKIPTKHNLITIFGDLRSAKEIVHSIRMQV